MIAKPLANLDFITNSVRMPSIPEVFNKVSAVLQESDPSVAKIAHIIEQDQAITARLLRIANSAAFGLQSQVASVRQAVALLGLLRTRTVVLQTSLIEKFSQINAHGFDLELFWKHAALAGVHCRNLARKIGDRLGVGPEEAYTCGLLHDIGKVVMLDSFPAAFLNVLERVRAGMQQEDAELDVFGFSHTEVGAVLAQNWKFPNQIVFAIRWHHNVPATTHGEEIILLTWIVNLMMEQYARGEDPLGNLGDTFVRVEKKLLLSKEILLKEFENTAALAEGIAC